MNTFTASNPTIALRAKGMRLSFIPCTHQTEAYTLDTEGDPETPIKQLRPNSHNHCEETTRHQSRPSLQFPDRPKASFATLQQPVIPPQKDKSAQSNPFEQMGAGTIENLNLKRQISELEKLLIMEQQKVSDLHRAHQFTTKELEFYKEQARHLQEQQSFLRNVSEAMETMKNENIRLSKQCEQLRQQLNLQNAKTSEISTNMGTLSDTLAERNAEIASYKQLFDKLKLEQSVPSQTTDTLGSSAGTVLIPHVSPNKQPSPSPLKKRSQSNPNRDTRQNFLAPLRRDSEQMNPIPNRKLQELNSLWSTGMKQYSSYVSRNRLKFVRAGCR